MNQLSSPYNWCDRLCERCPLANRCPVPAGADRDLGEMLTETLAILEEALREQGIDPATVGPPPPPTIDEQVLDQAKWAWLHAALDLLPDDLRPMIVGAKLARVAIAADDDGERTRREDTVPNLLLIEHLLAEVHAAIDRARPTASAATLATFDERDRVLRGLLAPMLAWITPLDRALIATLAAHGCAPSPFAICSAASAPVRPAGSA